ncbi:arabinosyltransferase domain-containing protein [Corynebacterium kutscheri]|nr:arabinosyltransferase domain-containing protein [Corynebacterium kutscheri]
MLLFLLLPFFPVNQVQSTINWPQNGSVNSVNAPLKSYSPQSLTATVPISSLAQLRDNQHLVVGTLPQDSEDATSRGLFVLSRDGGLSVVVRDNVLLELSEDDVASLPADADLEITSTLNETTAMVDSFTGSIDKDVRPMVTGVYTELNDSTALAAGGLHVSIEINSRFTSSPTVFKYLAMYLGGVLTLCALYCIYRIDRLDGKGNIRLMAPGRFRISLLDGIVLAIIAFWYFLGANTSDDGFILTMARASADSDYMANYYRWLGVPESPFGAPYYDLLALFAKVSTASIWMRVPMLLATIGTWFILSREVLPRLGEKIAGRRVAQWTTAFMFLAFWMAYNNGLRPEPIIAFGSLLAWASFERAIATDRLLPAAVGTMIAAFTLACGPTGLMAVAGLLACLGSIIRIAYRRIPLLGSVSSWVAWAALLLPFFAAGTSVLIAVFGDQTLMTVLESTSVRSAKGPALAWYEEFARYETLMKQTVDGSFARRFAFMFMVVSLIIVLASMLQNKKVPGSDKGPALRLVLMTLGTFFFFMFTPTKWTHHFGVFAGIGAAVAGLAAVALSIVALRSARTRVLMIGGMVFVMAFVLAGPNGWWYTSSYGIPWFDKTIQLKGIEASTVVLIISLLILGCGVILSFKRDVELARAEREGTKVTQHTGANKWVGLASAPIAIAAVLVVLFNMASFAKAFASQYPNYSVGLGNVRALTGDTCALANDVLVETNSNDSFLTPLHSSLGESLEVDEHRGFDPNNIPYSITSDIPNTASSSSQLADAVGTDSDAADSNSGGVRSDAGINGSVNRLPFGLDYRKVPVIGSYTAGAQNYAEITTDWYQLPQQYTTDTPLLVVSAAGRIERYDINGVHQSGQSLVLEYGRRNANGSVTMLGETLMDDISSSPEWRNLRLPLDSLPDEANVVRIHAIDSSLDPEQWIVFTPPRVPTLDSLNNVVGSEVPVLLDWSVPLQFPCQRPFGHYAGVDEIPEYRITPDAGGKSTGTPFQDYAGGGVMGTAEAVNYSYELPSYLKNDWLRDWGSIEVFNPRPNSLGQDPELADIDTEVITRSGLWYPGKMNITTE